MSKLRVLIIDDEPLARDRLRGLVKTDDALELIAEYGSGTEAIAGIVQHSPDIIFIDVEMPGCNGLQVVQALPVHLRPAVLFVTAHDRFAVEAFNVQAVDYLLKPFDKERFRVAVRRAAAFVQARRAGGPTELATGGATTSEARISSTSGAGPSAGIGTGAGAQAPSAAGAGGESAKKQERLAMRVDGRVIFVRPDEIRWVEAADNYVILHLNDRRLMVRETLSSIEERLEKSQFSRVNRSALVRVDQVQELHPTFHGDYVVILRDGTKLPLSRSLRGQIERFTGGGQG
ncbi:MAG TPA: LytTR family DNA-binding domain-containing protein [Opitutaceae bacterium]|nr:LytTR family DNA-binding domain-containing protein [Opitutaceae bacterium]